LPYDIFIDLEVSGSPNKRLERASERQQHKINMKRKLSTSTTDMTKQEIQSHPVLEIPEIQELITRQLFDYDENKTYSHTKIYCNGGAEYEEVELEKSELKKFVRQDERRVSGIRVESLVKLRAWKALRQCSRKFKEFADKMYQVENLHFLDAVIRANLPAVKFFLARKEIDPATTVGRTENFALLHACHQSNVELVNLLLRDERTTIPPQRGSNYCCLGLASGEVANLLYRAPNRIIHIGDCEGEDCQ
jgi:hypothetical protein